MHLLFLGRFEIEVVDGSRLPPTRPGMGWLAWWCGLLVLVLGVLGCVGVCRTATAVGSKQRTTLGLRLFA